MSQPRKQGKRLWKPTRPLLLLALLLLAANWRLIAYPNATFNMIFDLARQYTPGRWYAVDSLSRMSVPAWNPYMASGVPFVASQYGAYYPPYLVRDALMAIAGVRPTPRTMSFFAIEEMFIGGAGMLLLARSMRVGRSGALIGALAFGLSGFMFGHTGHPPIINGAIWLPWGAWALVSLSRRVTPGGIAALAGAMAMPLLAGHLPTAATVWLILGAISIALALGRLALSRSLTSPAAFLGAAAIASLLAAGLGGIHLIPEMQFVANSARSPGGYEFATSFSYARRDLPLLAAPWFYGKAGADFRGPQFFWEYWGYVGILPLLLAPLAFFRKKTEPVEGCEDGPTDKYPRLLALTLGAMVLLAVLLMLGRYGPLYRPLFALSSQLGRIRVPARWVLAFDFAIALLAALGADALIERVSEAGGGESRARESAPLWPALAAGAAIVAALIATFAFWPSVFAGVAETDISKRSGALAIALVAISTAWIIAVRAMRSGRPRQFLIWGGIALLALDISVSSAGYMVVNLERPYSDEAASRAIASLAEKEGLVTPTAVPLYRVEVDSGTLHESTDNGFLYDQPRSNGEDSLVILKFHQLRSEMGPSESPGVQRDLFLRPESALEVLDLLNAKFLTTTRSEIAPALLAKYNYVGTFDGVAVYERKDPLPPAWIVTRAVVITDTSERAFSAARLDPQEWGVLSAPPSAPLPDGITTTPIPAPISAAPSHAEGTSVAVEKNDREYIRYRVGSPRGGLLVSSELYYPGWKVYIDGEAAPLLDAQHALRGVELSPGNHVVEYRFKSEAIRNGAVASITSLVAVIALIAVSLLLRRRRRRATLHRSRSDTG